LLLLSVVLLSDPQVRQGLYYNPYFPGGAIAMPRMLADGGVEYDDGTPSNSSQQAKVGRLTDLLSFQRPCCPSVGAHFHMSNFAQLMQLPNSLCTLWLF
jgi:hypothetical protein